MANRSLSLDATLLFLSLPHRSIKGNNLPLLEQIPLRLYPVFEGPLMQSKQEFAKVVPWTHAITLLFQTSVFLYHFRVSE